MSEVYQVRRNDGRINIDLPHPLLIVGDIKLEFQQKLKLDILNLSQRYRKIEQNGEFFCPDRSKYFCPTSTVA